MIDQIALDDEKLFGTNVAVCLCRHSWRHSIDVKSCSKRLIRVELQDLTVFNTIGHVSFKLSRTDVRDPPILVCDWLHDFSLICASP